MLTNEQKLPNELVVQKRRGLVVWVYSLKQLRNLRKFGFIHHVSRKMKYVILYVNEEDVERTTSRLNKLFFVRRVETSFRPDINMNFDNRLGNRARTKLEEDDGFEVEELNTRIQLADTADD